VALGNTLGVHIEDSPSNTIGGTTPPERNLISGNGLGVYIEGIATGNEVLGNWIGTDATGSAPLGNGTGVGISGSASLNEIGGRQSGTDKAAQVRYLSVRLIFAGLRAILLCVGILIPARFSRVKQPILSISDLSRFHPLPKPRKPPEVAVTETFSVLGHGSRDPRQQGCSTTHFRRSVSPRRKNPLTTEHTENHGRNH